MKLKPVIFLTSAIIVIIGVVVGLLLSRQAKIPVLVSRNDPPRISFEDKNHELGTVEEGTQVPYVFKIHNLGGEPLMISNVSTSCGCTVLNLKDKIIQPGKSGELEVIMDTAMKQGHVRKEILLTSNDPKNHLSKLFLGATVIPGFKTGLAPDKPSPNPTQPGEKMPPMEKDPHASLTPETRAKIFVGNCATCHVQKGKGKTGKALFQADCGMCHGQNGEGATGPALLPGRYNDQAYAQFVEETLRNGSQFSNAMPGFSQAAGGPLNEAEIKSILEYLHQESAKQPKPDAVAF